jgi:TonB family protein
MRPMLTRGIVLWLVCGTCLLAHGTPSSLSATAQTGIEVISDTKGVDLGPYLQTVEKTIKLNWYNLIPESARAPIMKKGEVVIEFAILKDGRVAGMKLVSSSGDVALDRGGWAAITSSNPFLPLPLQLAGSALALRVSFYYNFSSDSTLWIRLPEQVRLREILIATPQPSNPAQIAEAHQKAQDLLDAIRHGGSFVELAKANSQGPTAAQGGDLGYLTRGKMAPIIEEIAFRMKAGDVSDLIQTMQGFVILQVTEHPAVSDISFEVSNQTATVELGTYLAEMTEKVRQSLDKIVLTPTEPSMNKHDGVTIQFLIERNGTISHSKVVSRSGNSELDDAALNAIRAVGALSPLPSVTKTRHLELRVHLNYDLSKAGPSATG